MSEGSAGWRDMVGPEGYSEWTALPPVEHLGGAFVVDPNGMRIGRVDEAYVDQHGEFARYLGIQTAMGHRIVVPVDDIRSTEGAPWIVELPYGIDRIATAPEFAADLELTPDRESEIYRYYGMTGYWEAIRARQTEPSPTPEIAAADIAAGEGRVEPGDTVEDLTTEPAPTMEIAEAEASDAVAKGLDPNTIRVRRYGVIRP